MRSLSALCSVLRKSANSASNRNLIEAFGFEQSPRWFKGTVKLELGSDDHPSCSAGATLDDEVDKIRMEFEEAKQRFFKFPASLREMPKMNPEGIYVNKNLRLDKVQVYGFDYDYTLAHYSKDLQSLTYDLAKQFLVDELKYPDSCLQFQYDPYFPIRGLYYDKLKGCLLKLDFFGSIEPDGCFFGRRKVTREQIKEMYGSRHIGRDQARGLVCLMDFFCLSEDSGVYRDSWRDLFDVVIARANKPSFYTSEHPFRCYDIEKDTLAFTAVDRFIPDQVYYHGCLKSFLQITKWNGPEVMYFGDHLFSDLRGPSKAGWRTAAIIHELENEICVQNNEDYLFQQAKFHIIQELLGRLHFAMSRCGDQTCHSLVNELNEERIQCRSMMRKMFNTSFGATFLTDTGQESAFAYHIHQYADVYTSKPENFLLYPPEAWLHVPFDIKIMPHHVKVPSSLLKGQ